MITAGARCAADPGTETMTATPQQRMQALLAKAGIPRVAIENPVCILSTIWRVPDQIIQPWMFGHGETKATCLWLKNLPKLRPTNVVEGRSQRVHRLPPTDDRWKL